MAMCNQLTYLPFKGLIPNLLKLSKKLIMLASPGSSTVTPRLHYNFKVLCQNGYWHVPVFKSGWIICVSIISIYTLKFIFLDNQECSMVSCIVCDHWWY